MAGYVFISYSRKDRDYVSRLASYLGTAGVEVWFDPDIRVGDEFERIIRGKIDGCAALLVAMTPDSAASEWVAREITWAEQRGKPIVPLLLAGPPFARLVRANYYPCLDGAMPGQDLIEQLRDHIGLPDGDRLAQLRAAVTEPQPWKRIGALSLVERLLGSVREQTREAARAALVDLLSDSAAEVRGQALRLWHARGLGDLPARPEPPRPRAATARAVIGIDFGTTNSLVGLLEAGEVTLIPNAEGSVVTPSVVAFTPDGHILVGSAAKRQTAANPTKTFGSIKLRLGTDWTTENDGRRYTAEDLVTIILARLRADVERHIGPGHIDAVLTVPAYFSYEQRNALNTAATAAGLTVLRIISEPTAAAITYGLNRASEVTVLMLDLGGGTFDVSVLEIADGVADVKATAGDNELGGDDWDWALVDHLVRLVSREHGVDLAGDPNAIPRLKAAAEECKIELSAAASAEIRVPFIATGARGPIHVVATISRDELERLTQPILDRCKAIIQRVIQDAGIGIELIDHVILVGGATRMPAVAGLALELTGKQPYRGIIPEGVVTGAALQAGILTGTVKDLLLLDVTPFSLGVETAQGTVTTTIEHNTTIPTKRTGTFTTNEDNARAVAVIVVEGENLQAGSSRRLAAFALGPIPPAPRGAPQLDVMFDIDANGTLHVSATDLGTGHRQSVIVNRESVVAARDFGPGMGLGELTTDEHLADELVDSAERALGRSPELGTPEAPDVDRTTRDPAGAQVFIDVRYWHEEDHHLYLRRQDVTRARAAGSQYRLVVVKLSLAGAAHYEVRYIGGPLDALPLVPVEETERGNGYDFRAPWPDVWSTGRAPF